MLRALYIVFALAVIGGYAFAGYRGLGFLNKPAKKQVGPRSVRGAHSGVFWYGGYRGGK